MKKDCSTCFYNEGNNCCFVFRTKIRNCWAWADEAEAKRREGEIIAYARLGEDLTPGKGRGISKRTLEVREILDERFMKLYEVGLNDAAIAKELKVSDSSVHNYRNKLNLPVNKNTALLEQRRYK